MQTIEYNGIITTLSPLAHNSDESLGTDTKYRRLRIIHDGKNIRIPVYSGNAFRGISRRIAARQYCELLGLSRESISDKLYYTWFVGGLLQKGSSQDYIEIGQKRELRAMVPFLSLFGTALQNQIIPGKMQIGIGIPICKETSHMTGIESELTIWEFLDEVFYTRRDDLEDPQEAKKKDDQAQQMKYTIEVLIPGIQLQHSIVLDAVSDVEISCFGYAMRELIGNGVLGGKSGTGHGKCKFEYTPDFADGKQYKEYVAERKEEMLIYVEKMGAKL